MAVKNMIMTVVMTIMTASILAMMTVMMMLMLAGLGQPVRERAGERERCGLRPRR
jgi:hypothetical protein